MPRKVPPPENPSGLYFAREFRGLGQDHLAKLSKVSKGQISKLENSTRELTRVYAEIFGPVLDMEPERILFWDKFGPPQDDISSEDVAADLTSPAARHGIKVVGYVGAGAKTHYYAVNQGDLGEIDASDEPTGKTVAVEIMGDSLGKFFDRWLAIYDDVRRPVTGDLIGKLCVVGLPDERVLVKKVLRNSEPGNFNLASNDENEPVISGVKIEWAAKVKVLRQR